MAGRVRHRAQAPELEGDQGAAGQRSGQPLHGGAERQALHVHHSSRPSPQQRGEGHRAELPVRLPARGQPADELACRGLPLRPRLGSDRRQVHARDLAEDGPARLRLDRLDAVLPGDLDEDADRPERREDASVGRPVLHLLPRRGAEHRAQPEQVLQGEPAPQSQPDLDQREHEPGHEPASGRVELTRLRHVRRPADGARPPAQRLSEAVPREARGDHRLPDHEHDLRVEG